MYFDRTAGEVSTLLGSAESLIRVAIATASRSYVTSIAAGNQDSDSNLDLLALDTSSRHKLFVLVGNKKGAFRTAAASYSTPSTSTWVTLADVNGDGKSDGITADGNANTVSVFLGNGNGTLQPPTAYATGKNPVFVAAADVNGDGKADLFTANTEGNSISVLLTSGSGFLPHVDYTVTSPAQLAFGDFNRDGKVDVVVVNSTGSGKIFLNAGSGAFNAGATLSGGGRFLPPQSAT